MPNDWDVVSETPAVNDWDVISETPASDSHGFGEHVGEFLTQIPKQIVRTFQDTGSAIGDGLKNLAVDMQNIPGVGHVYGGGQGFGAGTAQVMYQVGSDAAAAGPKVRAWAEPKTMTGKIVGKPAGFLADVAKYNLMPWTFPVDTIGGSMGQYIPNAGTGGQVADVDPMLATRGLVAGGLKYGGLRLAGKFGEAVLGKMAPGLTETMATNLGRVTAGKLIAGPVAGTAYTPMANTIDYATDPNSAFNSNDPNAGELHIFKNWWDHVAAFTAFDVAGGLKSEAGIYKMRKDIENDPGGPDQYYDDSVKVQVKAKTDLDAGRITPEQYEGINQQAERAYRIWESVAKSKAGKKAQAKADAQAPAPETSGFPLQTTGIVPPAPAASETEPPQASVSGITPPQPNLSGDFPKTLPGPSPLPSSGEVTPVAPTGGTTQFGLVDPRFRAPGDVPVNPPVPTDYNPELPGSQRSFELRQQLAAAEADLAKFPYVPQKQALVAQLRMDLGNHEASQGIRQVPALGMAPTDPGNGLVTLDQAKAAEAMLPWDPARQATVKGLERPQQNQPSSQDSAAIPSQNVNSEGNAAPSIPERYITEDGGRIFTVGGQTYIIPPSRPDLIQRLDAAVAKRDATHAAISGQRGFTDPVARAASHRDNGAEFSAVCYGLADALREEVPPRTEAAVSRDSAMSPKAVSGTAETEPKPKELIRQPGESTFQWIQRESDFYRKNPKVADARYAAVPSTRGGRIIGADQAGEMWGGIQEDPVIGWSVAPSEEASRIATRLEDKAISEPIPAGLPNRITITAGPQASGKSENARQHIDDGDSYYVFDGLNLDPVAVSKTIDRIRAAGKDASYSITVAPVKDMARRNAQRFQDISRPVNPMQQAANLLKAKDAIQTLASKYGDSLPLDVVVNPDQGASKHLSASDGIAWIDAEIAGRDQKTLVQDALNHHIDAVRKLHAERPFTEDELDALHAAAADVDHSEHYAEYTRRLPIAGEEQPRTGQAFQGADRAERAASSGSGGGDQEAGAIRTPTAKPSDAQKVDTSAEPVKEKPVSFTRPWAVGDTVRGPKGDYTVKVVSKAGTMRLESVDGKGKPAVGTLASLEKRGFKPKPPEEDGSAPANTPKPSNPPGKPDSSAKPLQGYPADSTENAALHALKDVLPNSSLGSVGKAFVPDAVRNLQEQGHPLPDIHKALLSLAKNGNLELHPEAGMNRLSKEDLALCPPGLQGTRLSWARTFDPKNPFETGRESAKSVGKTATPIKATIPPEASKELLEKVQKLPAENRKWLEQKRGLNLDDKHMVTLRRADMANQMYEIARKNLEHPWELSPEDYAANKSMVGEGYENADAGYEDEYVDMQARARATHGEEYEGELDDALNQRIHEEAQKMDRGAKAADHTIEKWKDELEGLYPNDIQEISHFVDEWQNRQTDPALRFPVDTSEAAQFTEEAEGAIAEKFPGFKDEFEHLERHKPGIPTPEMLDKHNLEDWSPAVEKAKADVKKWEDRREQVPGLLRSQFDDMTEGLHERLGDLEAAHKDKLGESTTNAEEARKQAEFERESAEMDRENTAAESNEDTRFHDPEPGDTPGKDGSTDTTPAGLRVSAPKKSRLTPKQGTPERDIFDNDFQGQEEDAKAKVEEIRSKIEAIRKDRDVLRRNSKAYVEKDASIKHWRNEIDRLERGEPTQMLNKAWMEDQTESKDDVIAYQAKLQLNGIKGTSYSQDERPYLDTLADMSKERLMKAGLSPEEAEGIAFSYSRRSGGFLSPRNGRPATPEDWAMGKIAQKVNFGLRDKTERASNPIKDEAWAIQARVNEAQNKSDLQALLEARESAKALDQKNKDLVKAEQDAKQQKQDEENKAFSVERAQKMVRIEDYKGGTPKSFSTSSGMVMGGKGHEFVTDGFGIFKTDAVKSAVLDAMKQHEKVPAFNKVWDAPDAMKPESTLKVLGVFSENLDSNNPNDPRSIKKGESRALLVDEAGNYHLANPDAVRWAQRFVDFDHLALKGDKFIAFMKGDKQVGLMQPVIYEGDVETHTQVQRLLDKETLAKRLEEMGQPTPKVVKPKAGLRPENKGQAGFIDVGDVVDAVHGGCKVVKDTFNSIAKRMGLKAYGKEKTPSVDEIIQSCREAAKKRVQPIDMSKIDTTKGVNVALAHMWINTAGAGYDENGVPLAGAPLYPGDEPQTPLRDLTKPESLLRYPFSPGSVMEGGMGSWKDPVYEKGQSPVADIVFNEIRRLDLQNRNRQYGNELNAGVENAQPQIKAMLGKLAEKALGFEGQMEAMKGRINAAKNPDLEKVKDDYDITMEAAQKRLEGLARRSRDVRSFLVAWYGPNQMPEWLLPHVEDDEMARGIAARDFFAKRREDLVHENVPVREKGRIHSPVARILPDGFNIPGGEFKKKDWNDPTVDPDDIRFAHAQANAFPWCPSLVTSMDSYANSFSKILTNRELAARWEPAVQEMDALGFQRLSKATREVLQSYMHGADRIPGLDKLSSWFYFNKIALSPGVAVKHSGKAFLIPMETGAKAAAQGAKDFIESMAGESEDAKLKSVMRSVFLGGKDANRVVQSMSNVPIDELSNIAQQAYRAMGHTPVAQTEFAERATTLFASLRKAMAEGKDPNEAWREAVGNALSVNFMGVDRAKFFRGSVGSAAFPFQSTRAKLMEIEIAKIMAGFRAVRNAKGGEWQKAFQDAGKCLAYFLMLGAVRLGSMALLGTAWTHFINEKPEWMKALMAMAGMGDGEAGKHAFGSLAPMGEEDVANIDRYGWAKGTSLTLTPNILPKVADSAKNPKWNDKNASTLIHLPPKVRQMLGLPVEAVVDKMEASQRKKKESMQKSASRLWDESHPGFKGFVPK